MHLISSARGLFFWRERAFIFAKIELFYMNNLQVSPDQMRNSSGNVV